MHILIAEDEPVSRRMLEASLVQWGHQVTTTNDGAEAWQALQRPGAPQLIVLDWMMPGMDGPEVCRRVRAALAGRLVYIILLTTKGRKEDIVAGLESGADDYVTKPFDREELRARLQTGIRILELQTQLAGRVQELEAAIAREKQLEGLLPICSYCKKIRDDKNYWQQVDTYVSEHSAAQFTHGICPECSTRIKAKIQQSRQDDHKPAGRATSVDGRKSGPLQDYYYDDSTVIPCAETGKSDVNTRQ